MSNLTGNVALRPAKSIDLKSEQRLRMKRFLSGAAFHVLNLIFILLCMYMGYIDRLIGFIYTAMVIIANLIFFFIIRSGLNLRLNDPSLTFIQILTATVIGTFILCFAGEARATFLMLAESMFVFGVFRFRPRDFLVLATIILTGYGAAIYFALHAHHEINLKIELLQFVALMFAMSQLSYLGGFIVRLRRSVEEKHKLVVKQKAELEDALQRISEMAIRDELTGAYNRRFVMDRLSEEHQRTMRSGVAFTVAMIDIDYFKTVNDNYGHPGGDIVLKNITAATVAHVRPTDVFARFGGEEFVLIMPCTTAADALHAAERLRRIVESLHYPEINDTFQVTISIGLAEHNALSSIDTTLRFADERLYQAKQTGRNRVVGT